MKKSGTPTGAAPGSAIDSVGLPSVGRPLALRSGVACRRGVRVAALVRFFATGCGGPGLRCFLPVVACGAWPLISGAGAPVVEPLGPVPPRAVEPNGAPVV